MNDEWNSGPPPHIGWWNASRYKHTFTWRWWNGRYWSDHATEGDPASHAAHVAQYRDDVNSDLPILWRHYYPKNARVPRVDPRKSGAK